VSQPYPRKFYGRKQGHKLNLHQQNLIDRLLPALAIDPERPQPDRYFQTASPPPRRFALEIGFGGGEHLLARAQQNPDIGFVGCEVFKNGVAKLLRGIDDHNIQNIRIYPEDIRDLLTVFPDQTFEAIYLLYPDPWPKVRHHKRRFISPEHLDQICRLLTSDGRFYFASDIADYVSWTLAHIRCHDGLIFEATSAADWRNPFTGWPGTRYEAKAIAAGRVPAYLTFKHNPARS